MPAATTSSTMTYVKNNALLLIVIVLLVVGLIWLYYHPQALSAETRPARSDLAERLIKAEDTFLTVDGERLAVRFEPAPLPAEPEKESDKESISKVVHEGTVNNRHYWDGPKPPAWAAPPK